MHAQMDRWRCLHAEREAYILFDSFCVPISQAPALSV